MATLQIIGAICLPIFPMTVATDVQGGNMPDDHALIVAAEHNDARAVRRLL